MFKLVKTLAVTSVLITSTSVIAHSEHDKARFVAQEGTDTSQCDNVLRPCKTIAYAVRQANKGDTVLVASGQYQITSSDELFYLKSALVPVRGGYNKFDHFQSQSPQSNITTLTNVPSDMVDGLRLNGFNVIADGKAFGQDKALQKKLADYYQLNQSQSNEACDSGKAGIYDCNNVDLLSHMPLSQMSSTPSSGNDIWGHVDLNTGNEFALMGISNGLIVIDVTTPDSPKEVGTITGVHSQWRDVKVYQYFNETLNLWQAYAYVTTEGTNGYVTIVDLNNLPNEVTLVERSQIVNTSHNVNISNVDYSLNIALPNLTPTLQIVGANSRSGAFQNFSLDTPNSLSGLTASDYGSGYTHDGAFVEIDDNRSSTNCGINEGSCIVYIDFNEKEMKLWNITDPADANILGQAEYNDVAKANQYVHSGWSTEDKQYILLHDEFDEYRGGLNTTVRIFSISDLTNPTQVGQWTGPTSAIDHNGFTRGNRYYMSNYERGLTVLDISDPANPTEVGFFDTYTPANSASFNGAWGVYPYLPSGNILISDINSGLYVLKDNTKTSTDGQFSFEQQNIATEQGTDLVLNVSRNGSNLTNSVSVSYQIMQGSAKSAQDFTVSDGSLTWAANDNSDKEITITIAPDASGSELAENFFVRLYNPTGGATLGEHSYTKINIDGLPDSGTASFSQNALNLAENSGTHTVNVNRVGSTQGAVSYNYALNADTATEGTDFEANSGTISWLDGENTPKTISVTIIDDTDEEASETFNLALSSVDNSRLGTHPTITFTIADDDNNDAPVVSLPEDFEVNTGQNVTLTAEASDANNDSMTYLWQQESGESVTLNDSDSLSATFVAPSSAGALSFSFTATDFRGAQHTQTINLAVIAPAPQPAPLPVPQESSSGGGSQSPWLLAFFASLLFWRRAKR